MKWLPGKHLIKGHLQETVEFNVSLFSTANRLSSLVLLNPKRNWFMRNPFFYILLLVLVVLDGWLLAHPNLIGQAGVVFFDYTAIDTFPKAIGTVLLVVGVALVVSWLAGRFGQAISLVVLVALLAASVYYLFQSFTQYNTGIYKLTGAGFRAGAILLPGLVMLVFGEALLRRLRP